jgi:hypothetical protein
MREAHFRPPSPPVTTYRDGSKFRDAATGGKASSMSWVMKRIVGFIRGEFGRHKYKLKLLAAPSRPGSVSYQAPHFLLQGKKLGRLFGLRELHGFPVGRFSDFDDLGDHRRTLRQDEDPVRQVDGFLD